MAYDQAYFIFIPEVTNICETPMSHIFTEPFPDIIIKWLLDMRKQKYSAFRNLREFLVAYEKVGLMGKSLGRIGIDTQNPYHDFWGMHTTGNDHEHKIVRRDTGIIIKGWTREEAIDYSLENEAIARSWYYFRNWRYMVNTRHRPIIYLIGTLPFWDCEKEAKEFG